MIKMFVSDIDGTMMQHGGTIDAADIQAMRGMAQEGIILCFASGRLDNEIASLMQEVGADFHRISVNGVFVYTHDDELLLHSHFDPAVLPRLLEMTNKEHLIRYISDEHSYYIEKKTPLVLQIEEQARMTSMEEPLLAEKVGTSIFPHKFTIGAETEGELLLLQREIEEAFPGKVSTFISAKLCLDIMPPDVSKGAAISVLLQQHGLEPHEMACIGDSYNDIPMFGLTPHSFAMQNADEEVRTHARHVVSSVREAAAFVRQYNRTQQQNSAGIS
ncbi:Cof-type HAD-IIB family hydrolase [Ectobacillus ponti]|uniref:Cof-type HAD-IIB family hydrolase n=1 Tax=Ectobacillus ponti TaxID=2961894 RepID=A0AA41X1A6_9BACI|nr:HAD family hydrolase [Ectobacillus ponti]MCP8966922.1 Cof-type HAD-IIB family hydrolase [Ectobacillus ponti]